MHCSARLTPFYDLAALNLRRIDYKIEIQYRFHEKNKSIHLTLVQSVTVAKIIRYAGNEAHKGAMCLSKNIFATATPTSPRSRETVRHALCVLLKLFLGDGGRTCSIERKFSVVMPSQDADTCTWKTPGASSWTTAVYTLSRRFVRACAMLHGYFTGSNAYRENE